VRIAVILQFPAGGAADPDGGSRLTGWRRAGGSSPVQSDATSIDVNRHSPGAQGGRVMRDHRGRILTLARSSAVVLATVALTMICASAQAINYNASKSNTGNVYFRDLKPKGQEALRTQCAAHGGHVVTNRKGQLGCQAGSLTDSKNISDGAAKGQANE
jgi:hypothetical protein